MTCKGFRHRLNELIKTEVRKRKQRNEKLAAGNVMRELASYCKISEDAIWNYRKNKAIPPLAVAIQISRFFNLSNVEELYILVNYDEAIERKNQSNGRGRKKEEYNIMCSKCSEVGYAKGLCKKHYQLERTKQH